MRAAVPLALAVLALSGCAGDTASTSTSVTTTTTAAVTTTTTPLTTTTTAATTTTEPPSTDLPSDACDQLDIAAIQAALGVASMSAGSPFSTSEDGSVAMCRFAITVSGNLGSSFDITMRAPSESGAFEDALATLSVGEPTTEITGLGERAHLYDDPIVGPLILVEYENLAAAWASAGSESTYVNSPADLILMGIMDTVVGPVLRALP